MSFRVLFLKCMHAQSLTCVLLFVIPHPVVLQAPLSKGFPRQEYWRGLPFPPPGDLPNPGIEPWSPALQADSLPTEPPEKPTLYSRLFHLFLSAYLGLKTTCALAV